MGRKQTLAALKTLEEIFAHTPAADLPAAITKKFTLCQARNSAGGPEILVTGYYQPLLRGSLHRHPPYLYPVYGPPPDLVAARRYHPGRPPERVFGRLRQGRLVPYRSRAEIESRGLPRTPPLVYLADPVDAFFLHVQGSGVVQLAEGGFLLLRYAADNGRPYRSIGRLLADEGKIPLAEVSLDAIRHYLDEHLDERARILQYNERYIFFRATPAAAPAPPAGSLGVPLVAGRSVALDSACFPEGAPLLLAGDLPAAEGSPAGPRLVFHHDSGAAIKGSGRLDLYTGSGPRAEEIAGRLKAPARLYVLIPKEAAP